MQTSESCVETNSCLKNGSWFYNLDLVLYSKTRSLSTIGAIKDHPYKPTHSQLETILTHIDAGFVFNVSSVEFGLKVG